jgi:molybdopterin/thiamine biosynthesis adenylyltransferase
VAEHLVSCGVGRVVLVDPDRVEASNVSRHVCDTADIGRLKTVALRDHLMRRNPALEVVTVADDFLDIDREGVEELLAGSDLALGLTDHMGAQHRLNDIAYALGVPALYAAAYERAWAGEVIYVVPAWNTPCLRCVLGVLSGRSTDLRPAGAIDYSSEADPYRLRAEPGLGIDIGFIVNVAARTAVELLLLSAGRDEGVEIINPDMTMLLWSNRLGDRNDLPFEQPLELILGRARVLEDCPVHGRRGAERASAESGLPGLVDAIPEVPVGLSVSTASGAVGDGTEDVAP